MDVKNKSFNRRAFATLMAGLMALALPVSGLVLHAHSDGPVTTGLHAWHTAHVLLGLLFTAFAAWHAVLNRRPLLNHLKAGAANWLPLSREARWAAIIALVLLVGLVIHAR